MIRTFALITALAITVKCQDDRRPFYVIGHMVNSIPQVSQFLELGANAIESDVEFSENGTALRTFHGLPCDCLRRCKESADIVDYFQYIRNVTGFTQHPTIDEETLLAQSTGIVDVVGHFDNIVCQEDDEASAGAECGGVQDLPRQRAAVNKQLGDTGGLQRRQPGLTEQTLRAVIDAGTREFGGVNDFRGLYSTGRYVVAFPFVAG
ncbi:dermonecrotic toxin SPH [Ixodes scapularis]